MSTTTGENKMEYPIKDYATEERQAECRKYARHLFIKRAAKSSFYPVEDWESDTDAPATWRKFLVAVLVVAAVLSLYVVAERVADAEITQVECD